MFSLEKSLFISRAVHASCVMQGLLIPIVFLLMFPLDSRALVPTAGLSPLLSSCTCQGPSAVLTLHCYTPPSSAPPAQL